MTLSTRQATNTFNMALAIGNNQQRFTFRMIGAARRAGREELAEPSEDRQASHLAPVGGMALQGRLEG